MSANPCYINVINLQNQILQKQKQVHMLTIENWAEHTAATNPQLATGPQK